MMWCPETARTHVAEKTSRNQEAKRASISLSSQGNGYRRVGDKKHAVEPAYQAVTRLLGWPINPADAWGRWHPADRRQ